LGAEAAVAGGAFIGMVSAAHASTVHAAPATRTMPIEMPSLVMRKPQRRQLCERFLSDDDFDQIAIA
jgi:hypothetical protein